MTYPHLFIRNVGNASANQILRVIGELGFGKVTGLQFRGNNAVAYMYWDLPNTRATRMILEEGLRPLLLYYSDNRFWKVFAYKNRENREKQRIHENSIPRCDERDDRIRQLREEDKKRFEYEQARLEKELFERIEHELLEEKRLEEKRLEQERLEQERLEKEKEEDEEYNMFKMHSRPEALITRLDYGNVTESYRKIRANFKARIKIP